MTIRGITLERILDVVNVMPLTLGAEVPRWTAVDAIVMASAAARGDVVFTGDPDDLERLRAFFPTVRVLGCGGD